MAIFFCQIQGQTITSDLAGLIAEQKRFGEQKISGLIEIENRALARIAIVIARGETAGIYLLQGESWTPTLLIEQVQSWDKATFHLRSLPLPDVAARLLWLALDSQPDEACFEIQDETEWQDWLKACENESLNGLVAISAETCEGLFYLHNGHILEPESIFVYQHNLQNQIPCPPQSYPWKVRLRTPRAETLAWQSLRLRLGVSQWFQHLLNRYQNMVGQSLTRMLTHNLAQMTREWTWEIHPENNTLNDRHFFPRPSVAAEAYRTLLMNVGEHVGIILGNRLAQRLFHQTFEQLQPIERHLLTSQRLIPVAFVD